MKFMILIHSNPESREIWAGFTKAQQEAGVQYYAELAAQLEQSGELIVTHALADPSQARRLPAASTDGPSTDGPSTDGPSTDGPSTDGPFAEVKEHLAGFFLVDCADMERAMEIADLVPEASLGLVEVRQVIDAGDIVQ